jgi:hypothetical protein
VKITGQKKLIAKLGRLPDVQRAKVARAIALSTEEGARMARTLAPEDTGRTRAAISTKYAADGMAGEIVAIDPDAPRAEKDRAYAIHYGRKSGDRGTTEGALYMTRTRQYLGRKMRARISRAVKRAAKEVAGNG